MDIDEVFKGWCSHSMQTPAGILSALWTPTTPDGAIDDALLQLHLKSKLACLRDQGLTAFIVSQFCFESAAILGWLERLRADGVQHQVRIGLAGPTRLRKLLAMGLRCGVGASMRALKGKSDRKSTRLNSSH